jgi:hypothetical protein
LKYWGSSFADELIRTGGDLIHAQDRGDADRSFDHFNFLQQKLGRYRKLFHCSTVPKVIRHGNWTSGEMTKVAELVIEGAQNTSTRKLRLHVQQNQQRLLPLEARIKAAFGLVIGGIVTFVENLLLPRYVRTCLTCDFGKLRSDDDIAWGLTGEEATAELPNQRSRKRAE